MKASFVFMHFYNSSTKSWLGVGQDLHRHWWSAKSEAGTQTLELHFLALVNPLEEPSFASPSSGRSSLPRAEHAPTNVLQTASAKTSSGWVYFLQAEATDSSGNFLLARQMRWKGWESPCAGFMHCILLLVWEAGCEHRAGKQRK